VGSRAQGVPWKESYVIRGSGRPLRGSRYVKVPTCVKLLSVLRVQSIVLFLLEIIIIIIIIITINYYYYFCDPTSQMDPRPPHSSGF
jgi:hypothetical protein